MTKTLDSIRKESDRLFVLAGNAIDNLELVFTAAGYVLPTHVVPSNRFTGVWTLSGTCWITKPFSSDMANMTDTDTDSEIMLHIVVQQWYYDKRRQNQTAGVFWSSDGYRDHIEALSGNPQNLVKFTAFFNKQRQRGSQVRDNSRNPNRSARGPLQHDEDEEAEYISREFAARFRKVFNKANKIEKE